MRLHRLIEMVLIVFLVLKLAGIITWPWWQVLSPLWAPVAALLAIEMALAFIWLAGRLIHRKKYGRWTQEI